MAEARRAAIAAHEARLRQHRGRIMASRVGMVTGGAGSAVLAAGSVSAAGGGTSLFAVMLGGLALGSAALGWRSGRRARSLEAHPPVPQLPPLPPVRLPPGARGAEQADRVANALLNLYDLVPNVGRLYPQAGQELWRAVSEVDPLLRGQVDRLASLHRIEHDMPGSRAAEAAVAAGVEVTGRLRTGADALEELVVAAARMLAAPDLGDGVADVLSPAITSLQAFTHGLNVASGARIGGGRGPVSGGR